MSTLHEDHNTFNCKHLDWPALMAALRMQRELELETCGARLFACVRDNALDPALEVGSATKERSMWMDSAHIQPCAYMKQASSQPPASQPAASLSVEQFDF